MSTMVGTRSLHTILMLTWFFAFVLNFTLVKGQADSVQDNSDQTQDEALNNDPNLINPQNKQGYGKNVPDQLVTKSKGKGGAKGGVPARTIGEQTHQAILQFGVLVAVSLLVGILFFINIGIELFCDCVSERMTAYLGRHKRDDIEEQDPAALVGTFKRYK